MSLFQAALLVGRVGIAVEAAWAAAGGGCGPAPGELYPGFGCPVAAHSRAVV